MIITITMILTKSYRFRDIIVTFASRSFIIMIPKHDTIQNGVVQKKHVGVRKALYYDINPNKSQEMV
jgi:hypothetical protein